jgi:hypothetical protein
MVPRRARHDHLLARREQRLELLHGQVDVPDGQHELKREQRRHIYQGSYAGGLTPCRPPFSWRGTRAAAFYRPLGMTSFTPRCDMQGAVVVTSALKCSRVKRVFPNCSSAWIVVPPWRARRRDEARPTTRPALARDSTDVFLRRGERGARRAQAARDQRQHRPARPTRHRARRRRRATCLGDCRYRPFKIFHALVGP